MCFNFKSIIISRNKYNNTINLKQKSKKPNIFDLEKIRIIIHLQNKALFGYEHYGSLCNQIILIDELSFLILFRYDFLLATNSLIYLLVWLVFP